MKSGLQRQTQERHLQEKHQALKFVDEQIQALKFKSPKPQPPAELKEGGLKSISLIGNSEFIPLQNSNHQSNPEQNQSAISQENGPPESSVQKSKVSKFISAYNLAESAPAKDIDDDLSRDDLEETIPETSTLKGLQGTSTKKQ